MQCPAEEESLLLGDTKVSNSVDERSPLTLAFPYIKGFGICALFSCASAGLMMLIEPKTFTGFLVALHFAISTMLTVGYGTVTPKTDVGKIIVCFIVLLWLMWISTLAVNSVTYLIFESKAKREVLSEHHYYGRIVQNAAVIVGLLTIGALSFYKLENHTLIDSFYWALVTVTTEGYGDLTETHESTKIFNIFFMFFGVISFAIAASNIVGEVVQLQLMHRLKETKAGGVTREMVESMDTDKDGQVSKLEFLIHMLIEQEKCEQEDIDELLQVFGSIDVDGDGVLSQKDIINKIARAVVRVD
ncbi:hypothetical protein SARC_00667 [Sphaeroforma arctica JP610]|uniref:EF-hand domain-containing protein n=1 Tax=Sphaeroforma arctica JP610 TaxID=667725 RepID=A0A0L0GDX8_9EUKA|nr:hypothetical protein SARC_00667 [Sphaeroforma arctica JP610]KNC87232.1 hypothetical protein SARC_00667 [Sphaeroforma arctica JP610]|eukprot:XP_014161134.1 hypothetical protein SARC_00667 [Sphaeroforma arctica JP610]